MRGTLRGVVDPELGANIVDLGMVNAIDVADDGFVLVTVALTIAGCPLRVQIRDDVESKVRGLPGVTGVKVKFGEMDQEQRSAVMQRARKHAAEHAPETEVPLTTRIIAIASGKGGVGKSSVTVNLASALAARGFTVGVLDADIWGFSVPRMLGLSGRLEGTDQGQISPLEVPVGAGRIKVVSMGFLVDDEDMAIMWRGLMLAKALEEFLVKVAWGPMDYLLVDMPPGTGDVQMALGRLLPRTEMVVVTTPALAAQKVAVRVADMARRSYLKVLGVIENMSVVHLRPRRDVPPVRRGRRPDAGHRPGRAPARAASPSSPRSAWPTTPASPCRWPPPDSAAGSVFAAIADRIADDLLPPVDMAGCTARMLAAVEQALG